MTYMGCRSKMGYGPPREMEVLGDRRTEQTCVPQESVRLGTNSQGSYQLCWGGIQNSSHIR